MLPAVLTVVAGDQTDTSPGLHCAPRVVEIAKERMAVMSTPMFSCVFSLLAQAAAGAAPHVLFVDKTQIAEIDPRLVGSPASLFACPPRALLCVE